MFDGIILAVCLVLVLVVLPYFIWKGLYDVGLSNRIGALEKQIKSVPDKFELDLMVHTAPACWTKQDKATAYDMVANITNVRFEVNVSLGLVKMNKDDKPRHTMRETVPVEIRIKEFIGYYTELVLVLNEARDELLLDRILKLRARLHTIREETYSHTTIDPMTRVKIDAVAKALDHISNFGDVSRIETRNTLIRLEETTTRIEHTLNSAPTNKSMCRRPICRWLP